MSKCGGKLTPRLPRVVGSGCHPVLLAVETVCACAHLLVHIVQLKLYTLYVGGAVVRVVEGKQTKHHFINTS